MAMKRWFLVLGILAVLAAAGGGWWLLRKNHKQTQYRTSRIEKGEVVQTVRATGVVQPIRLVQVGTQVSGPVKKLFADFNSRVKEGDIVAQIDPAVYEARLAQDQANLEQTMANVEQTQAKLTQASNELVRTQALAERELVSKSDLDAAVANCDTLKAQLKVVKAGVEQAKAALRMSKTNLDYTTIRSPVDGVVISRNVSEGQTVVASMSAQTIFLVAGDLQHVQVEASVPEADIGKIRPDQPVTFTVDAYEQDFRGSVLQVRLAASSVQNVVTYTVVVLADNPEEKLFPGMTANISCEVARRDDALKVANAALRFKPDITVKSQPQVQTQKRPGKERERGRGQKVWVQSKPGAELEPVPVKLGISDGSFTELADAGRLTEGQEVVTGVLDAKAPQGDVVNPFTPRMPGGGRPGGR